MPYIEDDGKYYRFEYQGKYYGKNTQLTWNENFISKMAQQGNIIWKHAWFKGAIKKDGVFVYMFCPCKLDYAKWNKVPYNGYYTVTKEDLDNGIKEFMLPKYVSAPIIQKKYDWDNPELMVGWIVYIIVMVGCLIFNDFGLAWFIVSAIFFGWRKGIYDK